MSDEITRHPVTADDLDLHKRQFSGPDGGGDRQRFGSRSTDGVRRGTDHDQVLEAFRLECAALTAAVAGLSEAGWNLPTRCTPWTVRDLLGHVCVVIDWLPAMLGAPAPGEAEISAVEYYRPDDRFSPRTNGKRIALAQDRAAVPADGAAVAEDFAATWRRVERLCRVQPSGRTVRTRHGDAMLLSEFLLTRVVEVAVHGLDLADALGREAWLSPAAGDAVTELLLGAEHTTAAGELEWSRPRFLRKATGREPLNEAEAAQVERLGIRWLALG
ncbi:maleylpyruvate isomerase family mycothiol-dependent enzyme [Streptomyces sp. NPDC085614]|uniref:maleylpyruvate isomerase family mycothiol-dependent enzyme n=1 Tax=Streptomyces sp. NPDC085614 TaxID=3365733 RepID=UPI0037D66A87